MSLHFPEVLTFVRSDVDWSEYVTRDARTVYLQHGTGVRLVALSELNMPALWAQWSLGNHSWDHDGFRDYLKSVSFEHDAIDCFTWCDDCLRFAGEDSWTIANGNVVCESCIDDYCLCSDCEEFHDGTTTVGGSEVCNSCLHNGEYAYCEDCDTWNYSDDCHSVDNGDRVVCESCLERNYSWCEYCEEYSHHNYPCDCSTGGCDCESPAQRFTIRNDGEGPLANDTRVTVSLAAGIISAEGIGAIARHLRYDAPATVGADDAARENYWKLSYRLEELGAEWQTRDGNYTKRLSRFAYKSFGLKMSPDSLSLIGNIARDHSTACDYDIETTRNLNMPASEFVHDDSCWWQSYSESRCALKNNGGYGLRAFDSYGPVGRAWVLPIRVTESGDIVPTFETMAPDGFLVFNGYGTLSGYAPARIVAHMAGMTYRKIGLRISPMYVNNASGYLVAPEDLAGRFTDGDLDMVTYQHSDLFSSERMARV